MSPSNYNKCKRLKEKIIGTYVKDLRQSTFYQIDFKFVFGKCIKELGDRKVEQLVCYGLGTFQNGFDFPSRYQLALLILIYEYLEELGCPLNHVIEVFDPCFTQLDKETLITFTSPEFKIITENEYCARRIKASDQNRCTLVYMPHLDKYLYNNLLGINWEAENLDRLVILGNSFHEMIDNEPKSRCKSDLYYLDQLVCNFETSNKCSKRKRKSNCSNVTQKPDCPVKALVEIAIDDTSFKHSEIFNSLAIHLFNRTWLIENGNKIEEYRLSNWTCTTPSFLDEDFID